MKASYQKYTLNFKFDAGTSRGVLTTKDTWYISLWEENNSEIVGIGEAGPLKGLSQDDRPDFQNKLEQVCKRIQEKGINSDINFLEEFQLSEYPSIVFALESAYMDLQNGGKRIIYKNAFSESESPISINGLVWMGNEQFMLNQIKEKIEQGYSCIKMKIGAIDFDTECKLLKKIRKEFSSDQIVLRVDANGAFGFQEAKEKLEILSKYDLHSIEQPIKAGNISQMKELCSTSPVAIALDEELIGINEYNEKKQLLEYIKPSFIILKPTLLGGFKSSNEWIEISKALNIDWWITSALESNIGLNAISQYTYSLGVEMPQGLGTGQLYNNNIEAPLMIRRGHLYYDRQKKWDLSVLQSETNI